MGLAEPAAAAKTQRRRGDPGATERDMLLLRWAAALYALGLAAHIADHIRRGTGVVSPEVFWAGMVSTTAGVATLALVAIRHRLAPLAAALLGVPVAFGVAAVHLLPHWSALSDAFPAAQGTGVTPLSWAVVLVEIAGALALGVMGIRAVRR
jgi:hypothetical protein